MLIIDPTKNRHVPVCPHCGIWNTEFVVPFEDKIDGQSISTLCEGCGRLFLATLEVVRTYTTEPTT